MNNILAMRIVEFAQDIWQRDPRANGARPTPEYVGLQLHFHSGRAGRPSYWIAVCATRPQRLPHRWHSRSGDNPDAALIALAREIGMTP